MKILGILVCCLVLCFLSIGIADAAWQPTKPVEFVVPAGEWKGPTFLADIWEVSTDKAERLFSFQSVVSHLTAKQRLKEAIARCYRDMK